MKDIINEIDDDYSGKIEWPEFASALAEKLRPDDDDEVSYKETFRVFSKDENGCITADEMKFVLSQVIIIESFYCCKYLNFGLVSKQEVYYKMVRLLIGH